MINDLKFMPRSTVFSEEVSELPLICNQIQPQAINMYQTQRTHNQKHLQNTRLTKLRTIFTIKILGFILFYLHENLPLCALAPI